MDIAEIIALIGGWSVLIAGISAWLGKLLSERMMQSWRQTHQREIEELRAKIAEDRLVIDSAMKTFSAGQQVAQERKLEATELLWNRVLEIRKVCQNAITFYSLLFPSEYNKLHSNPKLQVIVQDISLESIAEGIQPNDDLEKHRPYLGETLWYLFIIYRSVIGRLAYFIADGKETGHIVDWRDDPMILRYLNPVLTEEQMERVRDKDSKAVEDLLRFLEGRILQEISFIVSGERSARESFEHAQRLKGSTDGLNPFDQLPSLDSEIQLLKYRR